MAESRKRRTLPSNPNYPRVWATQAMNNYGNRSAKLPRIITPPQNNNNNRYNNSNQSKCLEYEYQKIMEEKGNLVDTSLADARIDELQKLGYDGTRIVPENNCLQNEINILERKYATTLYNDIPEIDQNRMELLNKIGFIRTINGGRRHRKHRTCRHRKHRKYHTRRH